jgi:hypothetical protein
VIEFILDGADNTQWRPAVMDIQRVGGTPAGLGAVFKQGLKGPGGRRMDGDYKITRLRPDEMIEFEMIAGPVRPTSSYEFQASGAASNITFVLDYKTSGLARLMVGVITAGDCACCNPINRWARSFGSAKLSDAAFANTIQEEQDT